MHTATEHERRRWPRLPLRTDCRLLDPRTGRFLAAESRDRSAGGARIVVRTGRAIEPGQGVALLLTPGPAPVLAAGHAQHATVRRVRTIDDQQVELALEFTSGKATPSASAARG
jgi:hypothetical protein